MNNENYSLYQKLEELYKTDEYPFHMPGHKRMDRAGIPGDMAHLDITEIEGFDNLHHAEGILREAMKEAAHLCHSEETYFLVNGSTSGILTSISAAVKEGETLLLGRNAHASAFHAAYLRGAKLRFIFPDFLSEYGLYGIVQPDEVKRALEENPQAKAVMITSPTYDGFVSDVKEIATIVHEYGKILIVDEAHGAHFGWDERLPESSVTAGADLVIQSLHKTMPALTQTAVLHVNGGRIDRELVRRFLRIYQSSSPSYLLMGSADHCMRVMNSHAKEWFDLFFRNRTAFLKQIRGLRYLQIPDENFCRDNSMKELDPGKLLILTHKSGYTGWEVQKILLQKYHLQMEMADEYHVVAIVTVMDEWSGLQRLADALKEIDRNCPAAKKERDTQEIAGHVSNAMYLLEKVLETERKNAPVYTMRDVLDAEKEHLETVAFSDSIGRISAESIYLYPPGIPIILPGEHIIPEAVALIQQYREEHLPVQGMADQTGFTVRCLNKIREHKYVEA